MILCLVSTELQEPGSETTGVLPSTLRRRASGHASSVGASISNQAMRLKHVPMARAGASLNVHVHFHLLCLDGVYVEEKGALRFVIESLLSEG